MARPRRGGSSQLGESWVVDNPDDSDASLEEDALIQKSPVRNFAKARKSKDRDVPTPLQSPNSPTRSSRASSALPEPELIMPFIHSGNVRGPLFASDSPNKDFPQARKRGPKASTPQALERARANAKSAQAPHAPHFNGHEQSAHREDSDVVARLIDIVSSVAEWLLDILGGTLKTLKRPISWVLAI